MNNIKVPLIMVTNYIAALTLVTKQEMINTTKGLVD